MKTKGDSFASREVRRTTIHLGQLIRSARLVKKMTRAELAARARTSTATLARIEEGSPATSIGSFASVMEQLGLLPLLLNLRDTATEDMLAEHGPSRGRSKTMRRDLDF